MYIIYIIYIYIEELSLDPNRGRASCHAAEAYIMAVADSKHLQRGSYEYSDNIRVVLLFRQVCAEVESRWCYLLTTRDGVP